MLPNDILLGCCLCAVAIKISDQAGLCSLELLQVYYNALSYCLPCLPNKPEKAKLITHEPRATPSIPDITMKHCRPAI